MKTETKKKLCWNCEGRVAGSDEHCPFCGVYLSPALFSNGTSKNDSEEETLHSSYRVGRGGDSDTSHDKESVEEEDEASQTESSWKDFSSSKGLRKMTVSLGMLLAGSIFFLFGLILWLFSKEGMLTLQWKSDYWYVYLSLSLVMLFLGWQNLQLVDD